jgi:hypothetical protein
MGFGLNIIEPKLEADKTDWAEYKGIMYPKNKARCLKAWDTIRERGYKSKKEPYGIRENKKEILLKIKEYITENLGYTSKNFPCNIFSLETNEYNLPNSLAKYENIKFFVAQNNKKEYLKMIENKPKNIKMLYYGCISEFDLLNVNPEYMFLDFCCTFSNAKHIIEKLSIKFKSCKFIFLTICLRKNNKDLNDYKFDMANKIMDSFHNFRIAEVKAYRDKGHSPMLFLILRNLDPYILDVHNRYDYTKIFDWELCKWFKDKLKDEYPDIFEIIDKESYHRLRTLDITPYNEKYTKMFYNLYNEAIKEKALLIPRYNTSEERLIRNRVYNGEEFFVYFYRVLESNLSDFWKTEEKIE